MSVIINASTSSGLTQTADTSGTLELQSNGTTQLTVSSTGAYGQLKSGTAVASTSGTSIDFTSIPSWVKRITIMFNAVSTSGSSSVQIQLGTGSTTYTTSGYAGSNSYGTTVSSNSAGFIVHANIGAATLASGIVVLTNVSGNIWAQAGSIGAASSSVSVSGGSITLAATLTAVRITTAGGTDTFDAGSINILYE